MYGYKDNTLWQYFHEDFEGFTIEIFSKAHCQAIQNLQTHLYNCGVWIRGAKGILYVRVLQACLKEEDPHKWTEQEIKERTKAQIQSQNAL